VFDIFEEDNIISHVQEITPYFESALEDLIQKHCDRIVSRRGRGLIQGLVMKTPVSEVISKCQEKGLLVISAEGNVLRLLPPLVIEKRHIDEMKDILDEVLR
jgi:acetylornithine/N-succinyldiaminopimelate aminotransferase